MRGFDTVLFQIPAEQVSKWLSVRTSGRIIEWMSDQASRDVISTVLLKLIPANISSYFSHTLLLLVDVHVIGLVAKPRPKSVNTSRSFEDTFQVRRFIKPPHKLMSKHIV